MHQHPQSQHYASRDTAKFPQNRPPASILHLPSIVQALLETKILLNNQTSCGCTPLWLAAKQGYDDIVRLLLAANAILDLPDNSGTTPLAAAVMNLDHTSTVNILLAANASIETTDGDKMTPFLWAALLSANADPEKQCKGGCTALGWALRRGQDASQRGEPSHLGRAAQPQWVREATPGKGREPECAERGGQDSTFVGGGGVLGTTLRHSQDVNGAMILKMSMAFEHKKIMKALLAAGAEVDSKDGNRRTVVSYAAASGRPELAKVLLGAGVDVDVDAVDGEGKSAVGYARKHGDESLVQLLLEHKEKQCATVGGDGESEARETELMNDSAIVTGDESFDNVPCAEDGLDGSSLAANSGVGFRC
ncbi:hypothetical protein OEA41_006344 [Lepraria neglecta]|uniref:Ankyrin n=1 Tax=Lepraria neglecta TaxID=209136 RepID=A0AAD9Z8P5_9LECA|nr:hypothetical protein OEA41_006344 [Lepraria neglecta]